MLEHERLSHIPGERISQNLIVGGSDLTVFANVDRLRLDLLHEATLRKGTNGQMAKSIADSMRFFFDYSDFLSYLSADLKKKGQKNPLWYIYERASTSLYDFFPMRGFYLGLANPFESAPAVYINLENIIQSTVKYNRYHPEVRVSAIRQILYENWRHEREHLVRLTNRKNKAVDKAFFFGEALTAGIITWVTMNTVTRRFIERFGEELFSEPEGIAVVLGVGAYSLLFGLSAAEVINELGPGEVASRKQQKKGDNLPNLFEFY